MEKYTAKEIAQAAELYPSLWVEQNNILNESGLPINFDKRKFLIDIYNDLSPKQVLLKPPQIGATVMSLLKSMWVAKKLHKDIIYTLPTATDVYDIVGGSLNRIIVQNEVLRRWTADKDTVEQKSIGSNLIRYRGTFSPKQATMVPSSLNIHDEVDQSDPDVLTLYQTRQEAQEREEDKWRWYFSHPSLAGHGVDIYWQQSDQKEWYITCYGCGREQILEWPGSINLEKACYQCMGCRNELSDDERIYGEWRATAQGLFSGYHISQLMLYNKSAADIIAAFNDPMKDKQYFWNYVLGLPYIGSEDKIDPKTVLKNCVDQVNEQQSTVIIGVDTGLPIHFTLMNKDGVFYYGTCEPETEKEKKDPNYDPYDKLREFLKRWPKSKLVSDQGGDLIGIRKLQAQFPGRVFLCYYRKDKKTTEVIQWGTKEKYGEVIVDRNKMIQLIVEQLREPGRITLNGIPAEWEEWAKHFGNIYREKIEIQSKPDHDDRSLYGNEYVWKRSGPDHYVHTLLYAMVGLDRYGQNLAKIIESDPLDGLPIGRMAQPSNPVLDMGVGFSASDFRNSQVDF